MSKCATPIFLSEDDKLYLKSIIQKGTVEARVHRRARILLLKSEGMSDGAIADKLDITRSTVNLCLKKYAIQASTLHLKTEKAVAVKLKFLMMQRHGLLILPAKSLPHLASRQSYGIR